MIEKPTGSCDENRPNVSLGKVLNDGMCDNRVKWVTLAITNLSHNYHDDIQQSVINQQQPTGPVDPSTRLLTRVTDSTPHLGHTVLVTHVWAESLTMADFVSPLRPGEKPFPCRIAPHSMNTKNAPSAQKPTGSCTGIMHWDHALGSCTDTATYV